VRIAGLGPATDWNRLSGHKAAYNRPPGHGGGVTSRAPPGQGLLETENGFSVT